MPRHNCSVTIQVPFNYLQRFPYRTISEFVVSVIPKLMRSDWMVSWTYGINFDLAGKKYKIHLKEIG